MSKLALAYNLKKRMKKECYGGKMAEGGDVERAVHEDDRDLGQHGAHEEGPYKHQEEHSPHRMIARPHDEHDEYESPEHEEDMVGRIMKVREHMYSKGGMIANGGEDDLDRMADGDPNDFDYLARNDDLEFHDDGQNSGDAIGDKQEDHDRADIVERVMKSRAKKDRLPRPA